MMNNLIQINLNQTVSKTQLKEQRKNTLQWILFSCIALSFLVLITWMSVLIINVKSITNDQQKLQKILRVETKILTQDSDSTNFDVSGISVEDVNHLKKFQENRIFWGPKLMALTEAVPDDMVITEMQLSSTTTKRHFKMDVYLRHDTSYVSLDPSLYIQNNSIFLRGDELVRKLKNSAFIEHFKIDQKNKEALFSAVTYEEADKKGNELQKVVFEGELNHYYKKKSKAKKRADKK